WHDYPVGGSGPGPGCIDSFRYSSPVEKRLRAEQVDNDQAVEARKLALMKICAQGPVAVEQHAANEQHYEVPAGFYQMVLGARLKYSSGYWGEGVRTLTEAEEAMLALSRERAELADGQRILELGCGWGSLAFWMAEECPRAA